MIKETVDIILGPMEFVYAYGEGEHDLECNVCHKVNYPMFSWPVPDDECSYIFAQMCKDCMEEALTDLN